MLALKNIIRLSGLAVLLAIPINSTLADQEVVYPEKMSKAEINGEIFSRTEMVKAGGPDGPTLDVVSMLSKDNKFVAGMYQAGPSRSEINEPYGVDEFMYFLEGSVTLTSSDGSVMTINAGEAATIPSEWTGIWETEGYTKIYVIHSPTGEID
ncbi:MAG: cupin domain-containing protein [Sphingomonadales bacterium]